MKPFSKIIRIMSGGIVPIFLMSIILPVSGNATPTPIGVIAAGVPKFWGETRDYDDWFRQLAAAGVTAFLPFSEYQEVPEALHLGYEADFFLPCSYEDAAFRALRAHHIQLVVAGEVLYAEGFPALDDDPLRALMACTGEDMIVGVLSIDEPAKSDGMANIQQVQALYERVKIVAPTLPVMMVHAPIPAAVSAADGSSSPLTQAYVDSYLNNVQRLSDYADVVGFDLYPIPEEISSLVAPNLGLAPVGYQASFPAYITWLQDNIDDKPYFLVLQAFSYERLLSAQLAQEARDAGYTARFPTEAELQEMACLGVDNGVSTLGWWGQSSLVSDDAAFWEQVLAVTLGITSDPTGYCAG